MLLRAQGVGCGWVAVDGGIADLSDHVEWQLQVVKPHLALGQATVLKARGTPLGDTEAQV